ncbi:hypothetical protein ACU4GA_27920 [Methylobacterium oryzae CBMB20]
MRAAIPPNLLDQLAGGRAASLGREGRPGRAGSLGPHRAPCRQPAGRPAAGRLDLLGTLRAASPWQALRRGAEETRRIVVRQDDLRIRILKQRTETTTVFCVDALGLGRPGAAGRGQGRGRALLAEAYVRRDRVALVAFRGAGADLLAADPLAHPGQARTLGAAGRGGTPLAAGIDAALAVALGVRRGGSRPAIVLLTDGRANVARSGEGDGRARARRALQAARALRAAGLPALVVDTGNKGRRGPFNRGRDGRPLPETAAGRGRSAQRGGEGGALSAAPFEPGTGCQRSPPMPLSARRW